MQRLRLLYLKIIIIIKGYYDPNVQYHIQLIYMHISIKKLLEN